MTTTAGFDPVAALSAAAAAAKDVDPQTVVGAVKAASSPHEAIANVQAIAAYGNTSKLYNTLSRLQPSTQAAAWQALSSSEQDQLKASGYHPPDAGALRHIGAGGQHGGIWSAIASGFHTAAHWAASGFDRARHDVAHGFDDTLNALGSPIRAVQHFERAGRYQKIETIAAHTGWTKAEHIAQSADFNPISLSGIASGPGAVLGLVGNDTVSWGAAWRATTTGNRTLTPALNRSLNAKYGKSQVQLALRVIQSGGNKVVMGTPQKTRQRLVQEMQDPKFQQMVTEVSNSRMSLGRNIVGSTFLDKHPEAGKYISGGIDAAFDFAATPLNAAGKAVSAARLAKYGIDDAQVGRYLAGDASRMDDLLNSRAVVRYTDHVGKFLENGDYAGLARFDPRLDKVASQLAQEGVDSAESFRDWLSGEAGMYSILSGDAARVSKGTAIVPHLTISGWMKAGVKEALQVGLDRLADGKVETLDKIALDDADVGGAGDMTHQDTVARKAQTLEELMNAGEAGAAHGRLGPIPGVSNLARMVRRMSTLIQTRPYVDIGTDADASNLRRFLQGFLPARRVDDVVNVFVHSDLGTRYRIVSAARTQMMHAFGLMSTPDKQAAADRLLGALEEMEREQAYSVGGLDQLEGEDGLPFRSAVLDNQLSQRMAVPMPNQIRKTVREVGVLGKLHMNPVIAATRMMYYWRSFILDRPGFAVRFSTTENLLRLLRTGPRKFVGSYLAQGAGLTEDPREIERAVDGLVADGEIEPADRDAEVAARKAMAAKPILPYHPVERALAILAERVPEGLRPYVETPAQFYGAVLGATTRKWARAAERKALRVLNLEDYVTAATHLYTHQPVADTFNDAISAMHGTEGFIWTPGGVLKAAKDNAETAIAAFKQTSHYSEATSTDPLWRMKWQFALDQVAQSTLGRAVLETMDKTTRTQERAVLRVLQDPEFASVKSQFARASKLPDGRVVGIDATQHEADLAFARTVRKHVNALVRSSDPERGAVLEDLVNEMLAEGRGPAQESLEAVAQRDLPASVYGPDILNIAQHESFFNKSWETLVGKPANWLARQPQFIQAYAEALPDARAWAHGITENVDNAEKLASDLAMDRAVNAILPFIHNPQLRTQFEDAHRILFPFLFAQRQFLQRWGRLMLDSPDAIRKIQLTMNGLRSTGFLRKNSTGQTVFYYPLSQYPQELLTHVLTKLGIKASVPMVVPFSGQVRYLMPGLSNPVTPSIGPFATVSLQELARVLPQLGQVEKGLAGQGSTTPTWQQFTPTIFNRLWEALPFNQRGTELASTMMSAIKYLDYAGYTLPNNATPEETEKYVSRVKNWAISLLIMRASLGFVLPATPSATLDPKKLNARWHKLLNELTYTKATAEFIKEHPTATAYTVGETQTQTDGYTPATKATADWLNAHITFAKSHPLAAVWFMPKSGKGFTSAAYKEQIALGVRDLRTVSSTAPSSPGFLQEVIMSRAANAYYTTLTRYDKAYTATSSSAEHQRLTNWWDNWKTSFFKQNPIFGNYMTSGDAHIRRLNTISDIQAALETKHLPDSPVVPEMRTMVENYEQFVSAYTSSIGMYSASLTGQRKSLKNGMLTWGDTYAQHHPTIADFWNTVVKIEVETQK